MTALADDAARAHQRRSRGVRWARALLAFSALAFALELALLDGAACGAIGHKFVSSITEGPSGTRLADPGAVVVNQKSGRVFVGDLGTGTVDVFDSSGSFVASFGEGLEPTGVAVDETSGDVYVADGSANTVVVFRPNGSAGYALLSEWSGESTPELAFGEVTGVAVDNSSGPRAGDVYVTDASNSAVCVFRPNATGPEEAREGKFLSKLGGPVLEEPNAVTVDGGTGNVYVADSLKGTISVYSPEGTFERKLTGSGSPNGSFRGKEEEVGNVAGVAVNASNADIYVAEAERHVISQFDSTGKWLGWITATPAGALGETRGVALTASEAVYVTDASLQSVDQFGPSVVVPGANTVAASKLAKTTAVLNGVVDGDGKAGTYRFQWGPTEALGLETPTESAGSGEEKVLATLSGLQAGATYFFRVVSENENGTNVGAVREFTTAPPVEGLSTGGVENLQPTEATLTGSLAPNGTDAHYYFEWGTTTAYGNFSPMPPGTDAGAGNGKEAEVAKSTLTGLTPNSTYHYRLVAANHFGTTVGEDQRFTTSGPPRIVGEPTTGIGHETATINAKVNPGELETKYRFEYGETTAYGSEVPLGGATLTASEAPARVSASLSQLKLGVTYHFRLVASNSAGTTIGMDRTFTTIAPAPIDSESVGEVSATGATLQAQINPLGNDTSYYFQYGTGTCRASSCADLPAAPGIDIGSSQSDQAVAVRLQELQPSTTYHYRVVASNALGTSEAAERTFTTEAQGQPFALSDGRAWELVSPPDKHGAPIEAFTKEGGLILAAEDGNSITYVADGAMTEEAGGNRSPEQQQIISTRGPSGWFSQDIATPNSRAQGVSAGRAPEYQFFTPDLSQALVEPWGDTPLSEPTLSPEAVQKTMYIRNDANGSYLPLVTEANVAPRTQFGLRIHFVSATPDLSHVVLQSRVALTSEAAGAESLYEWTAGKLQLVSVLPTGTPAGVAELGFDGRVLTHAISSDGTRVIWTSKEENSGAGHLYMRDSATGETLQLDAAQGAPEPEKGSAEFQSASSDGSRVFFTDKQRLTADSTAEPAFPERSDLYECEVVEAAGKPVCDLKDLTVDHNEGEHAAVQGFLFGVSEAGSSVYFVAHGVLAENENGNGERAETGQDNLYALQLSGAQWTSKFVAVLSAEDSPQWEGSAQADKAFLTARVSPDGRYLAFMSAASPTGYDNVDQRSEKRDEEVYIYDADTASLTCASCNPTGARPVGVFDTETSGEGLGLVADRREVWMGHWLAGNVPGWTAENNASALFQPRYLSDNGRLFFNSPDSLVPQATNNKENVYEYEPSGVGSCESPSGACVSLISSGGSGRESAFLEATPSGDDVFFITAAQLLPQDTDTAFDIYDARVCSETSPCMSASATSPPACSSADACHPAPPAQQAPIGPAGTATFAGQGNVAAQPQSKAARQAVKAPSKPRTLTREQKLLRALKACKRLKSHKQRAACERKARKAYAAGARKARRSSRRSARRSAR
jgi:DNA-binding beta-propeller fold protein YncE